jgi:hypothetical protein
MKRRNAGFALHSMQQFGNKGGIVAVQQGDDSWPGLLPPTNWQDYEADRTDIETDAG